MNIRNLFRREFGTCYLCEEERVYSFQELTKSLERNTEARRENTKAMDRLAKVVEDLIAQQHAVPSFVETSGGLRMSVPGSWNTTVANEQIESD